MPVRDIIVLGGSAGSVEAIQAVVGSFPAGMRAAVFIVVHLSPRGTSYLPMILGRTASLPVQEAAEGEPIEPGRIYIAPPDRHLLIGEEHVHLTRGPKEGLHRPSINATFRSAAAVYGRRVIGVVLSGLLDDGAAGLWEIARRGGVTIVQDPADAAFPSMPLNALQDADIDYKLKAVEIGNMVGRIVNRDVEPPKRTGTEHSFDASEFSGFTCPECRGPLYLKKGPGPVEFRCRVGHLMSLETLVEEATSTQERKLYEAIVALEEGADLASFAAERVANEDKERLAQEAVQLRQFANSIRQMIERRDEPQLS